MAEAADLLVKRSALAETKLAPAAPIALEEGEATLRVDAFSITANNVTYGAMGDFLKYWNFYPAPNGWGRVPVWGFATVTESRSPSVEAGERVYGYLPMSTAFKLRPGARRPGGFSDESAHRAGLAPVYNSYTPNTEDPLYAPDTEALQMLFRPLFTTSYLIDDFLGENRDFGARQVIFSSASAKTSYATAQLLNARGMKVIGLTSPTNIAFTEKLDFYDQVLAYGDVGRLDASTPTVYVDVAGNTPVRIAVHQHFRDNVKYSCAVGATHWDAPRPQAELPGPAPQMFFAPGVAQKRIKELGMPEFQNRIAAAWRAFLPVAARTTNLIEARGLAEAGRVFTDLVAGRSRPDDGHIIRLR
jgi:hypothetical protein